MFLLMRLTPIKPVLFDIKKNRNTILLVTSLLTGVITAFAGPIAFIGLAVPHITKLVFKKSNHQLDGKIIINEIAHEVPLLRQPVNNPSFLVHLLANQSPETIDLTESGNFAIAHIHLDPVWSLVTRCINGRGTIIFAE